MGEITIRPLTTYDECLQVHEVQQRCWSFAESDMGLYPPLLLTVSENGGSVLGAFDGKIMVGYLFGYPALHEPDGQRLLKLYSQTMGVLPAYRNRGIAEQLKWAQRELALRLGIKLVTWTFDPLESANAHLNLHKLGGCVRRYKRNVYGENFGQLNQGQPTDRFLVEWWLDRAPFHIPDFKLDQAHCTTQVEGSGTQQRLAHLDLTRTDNRLTIQIAENIQAIRHADLNLARDWRLKTRQVFEAYLGQGYAIVDFVQHAYYVLHKQIDLP